MNSETHHNAIANANNNPTAVDNFGHQRKTSDTSTDDVNHCQVQLRTASLFRNKQLISSDSNYNNNGSAPSLCSHCGRHKATTTMPEMKAVAKAFRAFILSPSIFVPSDKDLLLYVLDKIEDANLFTYLIGNVDIYSNHLENIVENYPQASKGEWYVFTPRKRMSADGSIPNRAAHCGYWEATGPHKDISDDNGTKIGAKEPFVYYEGNPPNGTKTNWIMEEYVVVGNQQQWFNEDDMKLDYVLCKIYKKEE